MRTVEAREVEPGPGYVIFRQSPRPAAIAAFFPAAALAALWPLGGAGLLPWVVIGLIAGVATLTLLISLAMLRRALDPDAWLMACDGSRVLVRLRSYLNTRPGERGVALEIPIAEIEVARQARLDVTGRDAQGERHDRPGTFLELELRRGTEGAVAGLAERLLEERRRRRRRGTTWRHYPVTLAGERAVRIEWRTRHSRVAPGIGAALRLLGDAGVGVDRATSAALDLGSGWRAPSGEAALEAIRTLAAQGRVVEATLLARRALGLDTTRAKALVDGLAEGPDQAGDEDRP